MIDHLNQFHLKTTRQYLYIAVTTTTNLIFLYVTICTVALILSSSNFELSHIILTKFALQ